MRPVCRHWFRIAVAASVALACSDPTGPGLSDGPHLVLQLVGNIHEVDLPGASATITAAHVDGSTLHLTVRYGGGCGIHRFAMVAGRALGESFPPYAQLRLGHDDGGLDPCSALVWRELTVDLRPIIPLVQQSGASSLRFVIVEPDQQASQVGELLLSF